MELTVCKLSENQSLRREFSRINGIVWPEFMLNDQAATLYWDYLMTFMAEWQFAVKNEKNEVIAIGNSIPVCWNGTIEDLPSGWDDVLEKGVKSHKDSTTPNTLTALAIVIDPAHQGIGLSSFMLSTMKALTTQLNYDYFIAPVRPSMKSFYPLTDMEDYLKWLADDGEAFDPWLRAHCKIGAKILKVAQKSMLVRGTVENWENWTRMRFPQSGRYVIKGALSPIEIDCKSNIGTYSEPNVWVQHNLKD